MSVLRVLGIDPGLDQVGFGLIEVVGQKRPRILELDCVKTWPGRPEDERIEKISDNVFCVLEDWMPDAIALERYTYQGDRSKTNNAFVVSRAAGVIEGACRLWARQIELNGGKRRPVVLLAKLAANAGVGLSRRAKAPKRVVKAALERTVGVEVKGTADERDGAVVAIAAVPRIRLELRRRVA